LPKPARAGRAIDAPCLAAFGAGTKGSVRRYGQERRPPLDRSSFLPQNAPDVRFLLGAQAVLGCSQATCALLAYGHASELQVQDKPWEAMAAGLWQACCNRTSGAFCANILHRTRRQCRLRQGSGKAGGGPRLSHNGPLPRGSLHAPPGVLHANDKARLPRLAARLPGDLAFPKMPTFSLLLYLAPVA